MGLLLGTLVVCAWLPDHDAVVLDVGRAWFLKPINKTHLWAWIFELWVMFGFFIKVYLKAWKTNWLTISDHRARDKSSSVSGVLDKGRNSFLPVLLTTRSWRALGVFPWNWSVEKHFYEAYVDTPQRCLYHICLAVSLLLLDSLSSLGTEKISARMQEIWVMEVNK